MLSYLIEIDDAASHHFRVRLTVPAPAAGQVVSLPVWIPGSYLVREFARHLSGLEATQGGKPVRVEQLDKASWRLGTEGRGKLELSYRVYAFDTSVRAAFLDSRRGFFNGTGLCLRVHGREQESHELRLGDLPSGWQVATGLAAGRGRHSYVAADYDELADQPVELGTFWRGRFEAAGVPHELVVTGALPTADLDRLLADTQRICETQIAFWHGEPGDAESQAGHGKAPFARYVFLLNLVDDGYGGLEHRASTVLIASRRDLPRRGLTSTGDAYVTLLGLISHEYFHTWNVKRLRPREFARYDYTQENYTELLWFFEGFTSYYDDLLLHRSGLIDVPRYLKLVAKHVSQVLATPGRKTQSVAQSSFDAWVKYYRADENTPNATVSYYTKGALVALALDLRLRAEASSRRGAGRTASLDAVMRRLWQSSEGGPIGEADIAAALEAVGGRSFAQELADWVHGTDDLPIAELLAPLGVLWKLESPTAAQRLGLRVSEGGQGGILVKSVMAGSAAATAGFASGDEWLGVQGWRVRRLDDLALLALPGETVECLVTRDQRLQTLSLMVPTDAQSSSAAVSLSSDAQAARPARALREAWIGS